MIVYMLVYSRWWYIEVMVHIGYGGMICVKML